MDDLNNNPEAPVAEQAPSAPESEASTQPVAEGTGNGESAKEEAFFDASKLSPELQESYKGMQGAFTKKMQELSEFKKKGDTLDQLASYEPFVKWYNQHRAGLDSKPERTPSEASKAIPEQPKPVNEMSQEEYGLLLSDPKKMREYVQDIALKASAPMIQEAQQKAEFVMNLNKVESFAKEHPDFWDLDKKGLIEPLIEKYPGMELDDVYRLAKFPFVEDEAIRKAHGIVQEKKSSVTEKPGQVMPGSSKQKVKSREEAMTLAWDYAQKGMEIPEFDYSK